MPNSQSKGSHQETRASGVMYALSAYGLWGILPLYWKALQHVPAGEILAHRILWSLVFVSLLLVLFDGWRDLKQVFSSRKNLVSIILGSLLISVNWLIFIWAVNNNKLIEASLGYYINPLFTVLLGLLVLRERIDIWQIVSLLLALVGVAVTTVQYGQIPAVSLSLATTFALYGLVKKLSNLSSLVGLAMETLMVAPLALGYLVFIDANGGGSFGASVNTTILLIFSGVATATPLLLFAQAAKRVPLSTIGFIQYLSPSIGLLLGIFVYKEPFTTVDLISFGFIWAAIGLYSLSRKDVRQYFRRKQFS